MNLGYLLLLITLTNTNCYNPKRHAQSSSTSNFKHLESKTSDPVIPARYKITSKTNYEDPTITESFPAEYFPEVEYPESIVDSSKPFYLSASPFPNDVKSSFNSLATQGNSKAKTRTDYSWIHSEHQNKEKSKGQTISQKVAVNESTVTKGNEINKNTNERLLNLDFEDDSTNYKTPYSGSDKDNLFTNISSTEKSTECQNMDSFVGVINDLDEYMKNFTNVDGPNEGNNSAVHTFDNECSNEFKLIYSDTTPNNNESIIEFNGNSFNTEEHPKRIRNPLYEDSDSNDDAKSLTSLLNELIIDTSSVEDMESNYCSIGTLANETNSSCTES